MSEIFCRCGNKITPHWTLLPCGQQEESQPCPFCGFQLRRDALSDLPDSAFFIPPCCKHRPKVEQYARLSDPAIMEYRITCPCSRRTQWHRTMEAAVREWKTFDLMGDSADEASE